MSANNNPIPPLNNPITAQPVSLAWHAYFSALKSYLDKLTASVQSPPKHNDLSELQGGQADQYYHLTEPQHDIVVQLPAFNTDSNQFINGQGELSAPIHNNLSELQGGTDNEYYHLTADQYLNLERLPIANGNEQQYLNGNNQFTTPNHNQLDGLQGGTVNDRQHLTTAQKNKVASMESLIFGYMSLGL